MAWTNLTFPYGSKLTSTKMTQLYNNVYDLAAGLGGIPDRAILMGAAYVPAAGTGAKCTGNIADVTKPATGQYLVTFNTNFAAADSYIVIATPSGIGTGYPQTSYWYAMNSYYYEKVSIPVAYIESKAADAAYIRTAESYRASLHYLTVIPNSNYILSSSSFNFQTRDMDLNIMLINVNKVV
jgi:hypothetical protein